MTVLNSSTQIFANDDSGVGTVGGFFKFKDEGIFGITNNHVIANANDCNIGDAVFQFGTNQLIGTLQHWVTLESAKVNYLDIALFKLDDSVVINWVLPNGSSTPGGIVAAGPNDNVSMVLPDGSVRTGKVTVAIINHNMPFLLCGKKFSFTGLIEIKSDDGSAFSEEGNSGSLIYTAGNNIVGVLLGTNSTTTLSYAVPFENGKFGISAVYKLLAAVQTDLDTQ